MKWGVLLVLAAVIAACGGGESYPVSHSCAIESRTLMLGADTFAIDCLANVHEDKVWLQMTASGGGGGSVGHTAMYLFLDLGGPQTGEFQLQPWTFAEPEDPNNGDIYKSTYEAWDDFGKQAQSAATAYLFIVQFRGATTRITYRAASGTILIDPASTWGLRSNTFGHAQIQLSHIQLQMAGAMTGTLDFSATLVFSTSAYITKPRCEDPTGPGGATCVFFKPCTGEADCTGCTGETCAYVFSAQDTYCCEQDGGTCDEDGQCCGAHCVHGMCMSALDAMENEDACAMQGGSGGTCGGVGTICKDSTTTVYGNKCCSGLSCKDCQAYGCDPGQLACEF